MYDLGCAEGQVGRGDVLVVLHFGEPHWDGITYGTWRYSCSYDCHISTFQIATATQNFLRGYWDCSIGNLQSTHVTLAIGTSNSGAQVTVDHARDWAAMVENVETWIVENDYDVKASADGASDMELAWNDAATTRAWVDAYDAETPHRLYNDGDAAGCPPYTSGVFPGEFCSNGWRQEDIHYISWRAAGSWSVPEIYRTDGIQARQWAAISRYGAIAYEGTALPRRIRFSGTLTQYVACLQNLWDCDDEETDNTPPAGWRQLWAETFKDPLTNLSDREDAMRWSADIQW
jgi:hypothetical protein